MIIGIILTLLNPIFLNNNIFLFTSLVGILLMYNNDNVYHFKCLIIGLILDFISNTIPINVFTYVLISIIIRIFLTLKNDDLKNRLIILLFIIYIYNTIFYLIFYFFKNIALNYGYLMYHLIVFYIENALFYLILYLIIKFYKKHKIYW